jgi:hypothetical protein
MSKKSLRAKAIPVLRLGVGGSPALQRPLGTTRDGKPRQIDQKGGNRVYNAAYLRVQKGNVGL